MARTAETRGTAAAERGGEMGNLPQYVRLLSGQSPIGYNAGDDNFYRYVGNAPTDAIDPTGLDAYYAPSPNPQRVHIFNPNPGQGGSQTIVIPKDTDPYGYVAQFYPGWILEGTSPQQALQQQAPPSLYAPAPGVIPRVRSPLDPALLRERERQDRRDRHRAFAMLGMVPGPVGLFGNTQNIALYAAEALMGQADDESADAVLFSASLLRIRLGNPPPGMRNPQAHHDLPQRFRRRFASVGLDVDNPAYGRWVEGTPPGRHQRWSREFNDAWIEFFNQHANPTRRQVLREMNRLRCDPRFQ
jgi:hypothetical protein